MGRQQNKLNKELIDPIINTVSKVTGVPRWRLCSKVRDNSTAMARFILYYAMYYYTDMGYYRVGKVLNKNHAAVLHGVSVAETWLETDRLRDPHAVKYGELLKQVIDKLEQHGQ